MFKRKRFPLVVIIILNWNGKKLLKDCLSSLYKLTDYPNYKVLVVDNGSTDGSVDFVKKYYPQADILPLDKNYGFAKGNNLGIKYVLRKYKPKYILLLNNDTEIIEKDWLTKMVEVIENNKKVGIVGCNLLFPDNTLQFVGSRYLSQLIFPTFIEAKKYKKFPNKYRIVLATSGACFLVKSVIIKKFGLYYDEIFTPASHEDIDYFYRLFKIKFYTIHRYDVNIIHKLSLTWKKQSDFLRFWLITRNHFILTFKHFKRFLFIVLFSRIVTCLFDKKDEKGVISLKNIRIRNEFYLKVFLLFKAFLDAFKIYYLSR